MKSRETGKTDRSVCPKCGGKMVASVCSKCNYSARTAYKSRREAKEFTVAGD